MRMSILACNVNLIVNGDGEIGPCEYSNGVTHPTGWSYHGLITQMAYNNTAYGSLYTSSPGPSDRGRCYFIGNNDQNTSMDQQVNLGAFANIIDSGTAMFNLSAWFGGWNVQDDNAVLSILFQNSTFEIIRNHTILGPFLAVDRNSTTCSIFRSKTGLIPANSRWMIVMVNITKVYVGGTSNDGSVDNMRFEIQCTQITETTTITEEDTTSGDLIGKTTEITEHSTFIVQTATNDLLHSTFTTTINQSDTIYQTYITTDDTTSTTNKNNGVLSSFFIPTSCMNSSNTGLQCNISNSPCDMLNPCMNNGTCNNTNISHYGYSCSCPSEFDGIHCEVDHRLCKEDTCWNNGICNKTSNTTYFCLCKNVWKGIHCEEKFNYCENITCENKGACRSLLLNYSCECLGNSYSGEHCEQISVKTSVYRIVSKSFAFIAIIAMISVSIFVIIMDIFKYFFNIDPYRQQLEQIQRKKERKHRVIHKFVYVNAPSTESSAILMEETVA